MALSLSTSARGAHRSGVVCLNCKAESRRLALVRSLRIVHWLPPNRLWLSSLPPPPRGLQVSTCGSSEKLTLLRSCNWLSDNLPMSLHVILLLQHVAVLQRHIFTCADRVPLSRRGNEERNLSHLCRNAENRADNEPRYVPTLSTRN